MTITPYIVGVLGLAVLAAGAAGYVQTLRLEAAQERSARFEGERDSALKANEQLVKDAEKERTAAREHQVALTKLRGQYEEAERKVRAVTDDGCLDRPVPRPAVDGVLNHAHPGGAGEAPGSGDARPAPGS